MKQKIEQLIECENQIIMRNGNNFWMRLRMSS